MRSRIQKRRCLLSQNSDLITLVKGLATKFGVEPALTCAVIEQESSWRPDVTRYEPAFFTRYIEPMHLPAAEGIGRATSFGLMQIMGEVAREQGFEGDFTQLFTPEIGVSQGLIHLSHFLRLEAGDVTKALLRWNGGSAPSYPAEVVARIPKYQ
jgi:soluble lytic murein transglycosylase-like protein